MSSVSKTYLLENEVLILENKVKTSKGNLLKQNFKIQKDFLTGTLNRKSYDTGTKNLK